MSLIGKISFELVDGRSQFENQIKRPQRGPLTLDEVELTEIGQTELGEIYRENLKLEDWEEED